MDDAAPTGTVLEAALLQLLVCPVCHQPVTAGPQSTAHAWLHCTGCGRYYPIQDGIPVMLAHRATQQPPLP
jgi:uncharacterized protein YbaR (Trm112 family)